MLDRLVSKNLMDRKIYPSNRRKMDTAITAEGKQLLRKLNPEVREVTDKRIAKRISKRVS